MRNQLFALMIILAPLMLPGSSLAQAPDVVSVDNGPLAQMLEVLIIQQGVDIMAQNIKASANESGDLNKAIRATLGISIGDINKYGLLGGPNSEMRKLFKALGLQ